MSMCIIGILLAYELLIFSILLASIIESYAFYVVGIVCIQL